MQKLTRTPEIAVVYEKTQLLWSSLQCFNPLTFCFNNISIALYASEEYVRVRLGVKAKHQSEADEFVKQTKKMIEEKLKDYLVENPNLFEEVMKKVNGFTILNECDFLLSDYFVNNGGPVFIHLTLKEA